jgi:hypothetical protein
MRANATSQHRSLCKNNQAFMEAQTSDSHCPTSSGAGSHVVERYHTSLPCLRPGHSACVC